MSPITTSAVVAGAKHIAEKEAIKTLVQYFKEKVIGRWSEHRADRFFSAFVDEVRKEKDIRFESADLNDMLRMIAASDKQTAVLFDAYRRVALSASKDVGPMVIGMLTAAIALEDRDATTDEELIFQGAEALNDRDFDDLHKWLEYARTVDNASDEGEVLNVLIKTGPEQPAGVSLLRVGAGIDDMPMNIAEDLGVFALKLKNIGLLAETMRRRENPREVGATRYYAVISVACQRLDQLAARAKSAKL